MEGHLFGNFSRFSLGFYTTSPQKSGPTISFFLAFKDHLLVNRGSFEAHGSGAVSAPPNVRWASAVWSAAQLTLATPSGSTWFFGISTSRHGCPRTTPRASARARARFLFSRAPASAQVVRSPFTESQKADISSFRSAWRIGKQARSENMQWRKRLALYMRQKRVPLSDAAFSGEVDQAGQRGGHALPW